jgi:hypothetical protein
MSLTHSQRLAVLALTPIQTYMAWTKLAQKNRSVSTPPALILYKVDSVDDLNTILPSPEEFLDVVTSVGIDHASVVVPLCSVSHQEATRALETLIGRPLTRLAPKGKARPPTDPRVRMGMIHRDGSPRTPKERGGSVASTDTRTITYVAENPKKPGSASYDRFALYAVGDKVMDAIAKGVTSGDIRWDLERGFIKLGV